MTSFEVIFLFNILCGVANDVHGDNADADQYRQQNGDLIQNSIARTILILAEIAISIGTACHRAQALRLALLDRYTYNDCDCQNQNRRTKDI